MGNNIGYSSYSQRKYDDDDDNDDDDDESKGSREPVGNYCKKVSRGKVPCFLKILYMWFCLPKVARGLRISH